MRDIEDLVAKYAGSQVPVTVSEFARVLGMTVKAFHKRDARIRDLETEFARLEKRIAQVERNS